MKLKALVIITLLTLCASLAFAAGKIKEKIRAIQHDYEDVFLGRFYG